MEPSKHTIPAGAFVRHLKSGKTGRIVTGRLNPYYNYHEYHIKLITQDGSYKKTSWSIRNVEQIPEPPEPEKPEKPEPEKESFRNVEPMVNPFSNGVFFSAKFWLTPEPGKKY